MAYNLRGRRVAYDNIASGSVAGFENHHPANEVSDVSAYGNSREAGGFSNISVGNLPGVEDTDNNSADKLTSDGETVAD